MIYSVVLDVYQVKSNDPSILLLCCIACIIHHSDQLVQIMINNPGHYLCRVPILSESALLKGLRDLVTTDQTVGVVENATVTPPSC